jgi:hypothetical protein
VCRSESPLPLSSRPIIPDDFRTVADGAGHGYQTMINEALRLYVAKAPKPVDETVLRQVLREELKRAAHD